MIIYHLDLFRVVSFRDGIRWFIAVKLCSVPRYRGWGNGGEVGDKLCPDNHKNRKHQKVVSRRPLKKSSELNSKDM